MRVNPSPGTTPSEMPKSSSLPQRLYNHSAFATSTLISCAPALSFLEQIFHWFKPLILTIISFFFACKKALFSPKHPQKTSSSAKIAAQPPGNAQMISVKCTSSPAIHAPTPSPPRYCFAEEDRKQIQFVFSTLSKLCKDYPNNSWIHNAGLGFALTTHAPSLFTAKSKIQHIPRQATLCFLLKHHPEYLSNMLKSQACDGCSDPMTSLPMRPWKRFIAEMEEAFNRIAADPHHPEKTDPILQEIAEELGLQFVDLKRKFAEVKRDWERFILFLMETQ